MLKLVVTLEKLDKDDEDLDIDGLSWDADNGSQTGSSESCKELQSTSVQRKGKYFQ